MSGYRILVVDDKRELAQGAAPILNKLSDNIAVAYSAEEAIEMLDQCPADVILSDVRMPGRDGASFLDLARQRWPSTRVILFAANGSTDSAIQAVKLGAFDYLTKPFDNDELLAVTSRALKEIKDEEEIARLRAEVHRTYGFHGIYTRDRRMLRVIDTIRRVAATNAMVLISGESGTGKELVAQAIHAESPRAAGPFVVFNAAARPEIAAEAGLFGYKKGPPNGMEPERDGLFLEAHGGTLLIDEVSSLSMGLQGKLLRALQRRDVFRLSSGSNSKAGVRVVATTNLDSRRLLREEILRIDLYYRLAAMRISIPPLRERLDDIPLLADVFLERLVQEGQQPKSLSPGALRTLISHNWPGNVRELRSVIERAALVCCGEDIGPEDIIFEDDALEWCAGRVQSLAYEEAKREAVERFQRRYIDDLMAKCDGNISAAARRAGMTRAALHRILKRLGVEHDEERDHSSMDARS